MRAKVPPIVWLIIGVTVSALAAPTVVAAATATLVKLQGVALTPAKQLTATETAPANFRQYSISSGAGIGGCQALTTLPTTSGLVVTELRVAWRQESAGAEVNFYAGASCAGPLIGSLAAGFAGTGVTTATTATTPIDPGFALPPDTTISVNTTFGGVSAFVGDLYLNGYSVPPADVPSVTGSN